MFPTPVAVVLTAVFLATGLIGSSAVVRGARARALGPCGDTRATELLHVLMSLAMIAMAWGWTGGPDTIGGAVQLVVFGGFAVVLGTLGVLGLLGVDRGRRAARGARLSHGLMAAAMVWMVAAMPLLMHAAATPTGAMSPAAAHAGHGAGAMAGSSMAGSMAGASTALGSPAPGAMAPGSTAGWASAASTVLVALLVVVGVAWVVRTVQLASPAHRARCAEPLPIPVPRREQAPVRVPVVASGAGSPDPVDAPARRPAAGVPTTDGAPARAAQPAILAASCHALMGLGMAAMLVAML